MRADGFCFTPGKELSHPVYTLGCLIQHEKFCWRQIVSGIAHKLEFLVFSRCHFLFSIFCLLLNIVAGDWSLMEYLKSSSIRVPGGGDKVYKDECVYCFNSPVHFFFITRASLSVFSCFQWPTRKQSYCLPLLCQFLWIERSKQVKVWCDRSSRPEIRYIGLPPFSELPGVMAWHNFWATVLGMHQSVLSCRLRYTLLKNRLKLFLEFLQKKF